VVTISQYFPRAFQRPYRINRNEKDVETPYVSFSNAHQAVNGVANCRETRFGRAGDYRKMANYERVFAMSFAGVHPHYVAKVEKKGRTVDELHEVLRWLTGYSQDGLERVIKTKVDLRTFFEQAPQLNPNASLIKGVVCGIRVEDIEDPLMQKIRWMDKLVDELAKGKKMEKILRMPE